MNRKLRILIFTPSLPYPPIWGFGIRVYQLLRQLALRHEVSILTFAPPESESDVSRLRQECHAVHTVPFPKHNRRLLQATSLLSPKSFLQMDLFSAAMQLKIDTLLQENEYDIIQVESSHLGAFQFRSDAVLALDEHNIEYELLQRMVQTEKSPLRRLFNWTEFRKFRVEEHKCWSAADFVMMTSERERCLVQRFLPDKRVACVPNGVDIEYFLSDGSLLDPNSIVMTGLMSYRPNIDAAVFFAKDVLPHIHKSRPDAVFTIVGAGPTSEVRALAGPHVLVTDTVPDVRPYVQRASALVVPLRMGSGTRLKVLQGLAMSKAIVSTSLGCEGIDVEGGEHLLIADDADSFAAAVLRVMDDKGLSASLGRHARLLAEDRYSWVSIVANLERMYLQHFSEIYQMSEPPTAVA